jgi:hypothetical protein
MNAIPPAAEYVAAARSEGWHLFFLEISEWPIGPATDENPEVMDWIRIQFRNAADPQSPLNGIRLHSSQLCLPHENPYSSVPRIEVISNSDAAASFLQVRVAGLQDPAAGLLFPPTCEVYLYFFVQEPLDEASVFYYCSEHRTYDASSAAGGTGLPNLALRLQRGANSENYRLATGLETTRVQPASGACGDYPDPDVADVRNRDSLAQES